MASKIKLLAIIGADAKGFNKAMKGVAEKGKAAAAAVGAAAAASGAFAVKKATDFEKAMAEIGTISGHTVDKLGKVGDQVLKLSEQFGMTTEELTGGLYQALSAGVPKKNALQFLEIASKAAIGGITDASTAVDGITTAINSFGLSATDAKHVSDVLFATVTAGKTTFPELASSIGKAAALAKGSGMTFAEFGATIATLTKGGLSTSEAMTAIKAALSNLSKPSKEMAVKFKELGITSAEAAIDQQGLAGVMLSLMNSVDGNEAAFKKLFGSVEAANGGLILTSNNGKNAKKDIDNVTFSANASDEAFAKMADTADMSFKKIKASFNVLAIKIGQELLPIVVQAAEELLKVLSNDQIIEAIEMIAKGVATLLGTIMDFFQFLAKAKDIPLFEKIIDKLLGLDSKTFDFGEGIDPNLIDGLIELKKKTGAGVDISLLDEATQDAIKKQPTLLEKMNGYLKKLEKIQVYEGGS